MKMKGEKIGGKRVSALHCICNWNFIIAGFTIFIFNHDDNLMITCHSLGPRVTSRLTNVLVKLEEGVVDWFRSGEILRKLI